MKSYFIFLLANIFIAGSISAQTDSTTYLRVEDPTQIFNSIRNSAGVTMAFLKNPRNGFGNPGVYDAFWELGIEGTVAFKKTSFTMTLPITNNGNPQTALGDLQLEAGYQIHNGNNTYKSTLITAGIRFPTGLDSEYSDYSSFSYNGYFGFHIGYVGSVKLSDHWFVYPRLTLYYKSSTPQTTIYIGDTCREPPSISEPGFQIGAGTSYRFNKRSFILLNADFQRGSRSSIDNCGNDNFNISEVSEDLLFGFRYQFAVNLNNAVFLQLNSSFSNLKGEPYLNYANGTNNFGFMFGYQYNIAR